MLKIDKVCYRYKNSEKSVLKDVSAGFEGGKVHAIIGPSGSGKTTLLSIMAGLDRPTSGEVIINGSKLSGIDLDQYRRESISMIFQAFNLFPFLSALENTCYPMELLGVEHKEAKAKAKDLLISLGIDDAKQQRYPANLSGGEQQRVAIARALSSGAKVILADEPTGNLDSANGETVVNILRHLAHSKDYCIVVVTHDLAIAQAADVVFKMSDGVLAG